MKKPSAFTLIELMLVVAVVITLALIAIPSYSKSKNRALQKEAISNLKLIAAGERIYKMESNSYVGCSCTSAANCANTSNGCNYLLKLMLNTVNWTYSVSTSGGSGCTITAYSSGIGCTYTLNSSGFDTQDYSTSSGCS
jgi:type II secretory pathway pseudopilin PulG